MRYLVIISFIILTACNQQEVEFPASRDVVVVEGWVTTEDKQHSVKLSRTVGFQANEPESPITDASIVINDLVDDYPLTHSENGIYLTNSFAGTIGRRYTITITLSNGDVITSTAERLNPVTDINDVSFDSFNEQDPETGDDVEIYFPIVTTQDPLEETNYYRYVGYRNNNLLDLPEELEILSDQFINGKSLSHNIPSFRYDLNDNVTIELYSITESAYNFLELLKLQTTSIGSSSGTAPASLVGNLSYNSRNDIVLGYFGASDVKSISTVLE